MLDRILVSVDTNFEDVYSRLVDGEMQVNLLDILQNIVGINLFCCTDDTIIDCKNTTYFHERG